MTLSVKVLLICTWGFLLAGCGGGDTSTRPSSMLSPFAGTYKIDSAAYNKASSRGMAFDNSTHQHQRKVIDIKANGDVDFDNGIMLPAHFITTEYDHRAICDFPAAADPTTCRIHIVYDNDNALEIFLDTNKTRVVEIRYTQDEHFIVRAPIITDKLTNNDEALHYPDYNKSIQSNKKTAAAEKEKPFQSLGELQHTASTKPATRLQDARTFITLNDDSILWAGSSGFQSDKNWLIGRVHEKQAEEQIVLIAPPSNSISEHSMAARLLADESNKFLYVLGKGLPNEYLVSRLHLDDLSLDLSFGNAGFSQLRNDTALVYGFALDGNGGLLVSGSNGNLEYQVYRFTKQGQPDYEFGNNGVLIEIEE